MGDTLFVFEIFEIAQKTKKIALMSYLLGSSQGCLGVPRHGPCGSVRSHKIFFEITIHIKSIIYLSQFVTGRRVLIICHLVITTIYIITILFLDKLIFALNTIRCKRLDSNAGPM